MTDEDSSDGASRPTRAVGLRTALLSIAGFWLFYFAVVTVRSVVLGFGDQVEMLGRRTIVSLASMGLTILLYLVLRRFSGATLRQSIVVAALAAIPAAILYATINWMAFRSIAEAADKQVKSKVEIVTDQGVLPPAPPLPPPPPAAPPIPALPAVPSPSQSISIQVGGEPEESRKKELTPVQQVADHAANGYFFFAAWAALYLALCYAAEVRAVERRAARFRAAAQSAELRALRYQVNPHFLFNTLNALSSLVMVDRREEAERMILNLSTFFRTSLTTDPAEDVPLSEEIRLQRLYLDIEAVRFPERLVVEIDVPDDLQTACVPALILQPLVENAIKYGVSRARRPVTVRIRARQQGEEMLLTVEDDGDPSGPSAAGGTGVGLRNVADRLAARFGDAAEARWGPRAGGGFAVSLRMPVVRRGC